MITFDKLTIVDGQEPVAEFSFNNSEGKKFRIRRKLSAVKFTDYAFMANYAAAVKDMVYHAVQYYRKRRCPDTPIKYTVEGDIYLAIFNFLKGQ